jgi:hypothetical protein
MRNILIAVLLLLTSNVCFSQCIITGMNYLKEEEGKSDIIESEPDEILPHDFITTADMIRNFFAVNCKFRVYSEKETSGAKTFCSCTGNGCESTVFVGKKLLQEYRQGFSTKDGLWGIVAHELAHVLQCSNNISLTGAQRELHADFLAGYFLGVKMRIQLTNISEFSGELFRRGDFQFNDRQHHGTPEARVRYMLSGASLSMLNLRDAYNYGINLISGNLAAYNINGVWRSDYNVKNNIPINSVITSNIGNFVFQPFNVLVNQFIAPPVLAQQINVNQYRIIWPGNGPFMPNIVQDFIVINSGLIVVMNSNGAVDIWMRSQ